MSNKNPKVVHETVLKDIMDIWDGIKQLSSDKIRDAGKKNPMTSSSIAKASSNLNLVFPVICSRGISIENASMISKAVERNAVTMLQRLFASWQIAGEDINSVQTYINQFHKNLSSKSMSLDDLFELSDRIDGTHTGKDYSFYVKEGAIKADLANLDFYLPTSINESSLLQYSVKEGAVTNDIGNNEDGNEANKSTTIERKNKEYDKLKNSAEYFSKQVADSDFKKANELMPTTMTVNFKTISDGKVVDITDGVIGVKAKLYPIGSEDIVKHIADKNTDSIFWSME